MINSVEKIESKTAGTSEIDFIPYASSKWQTLAAFDVEISSGLSTESANQKILTNGKNTIEQKGNLTAWHLVRDQFSSIVVWLLAFAALVAFFTNNQLEALAILVVLILNALIGFLIEWRAGRALETLRKATKTNAHVRRDGHEQIIDAENLVSGDILVLTAGDRVPADVRILESANLRADESTLTGESTSVEKNSQSVEPDTPLAERRSMLYLGTTVVAGNSLGIVTATGQQTELGHIGKMVATAEQIQTPLQRRLENLGKKLVYIVLGIALVVLLAGVIRGDNIWLMLEVSISLAVAAVPEGLPAVTTLILALGVLRMARRNAIVRRLAAVETLGSSTVICSDKTGTLTENRMTVKEFRLSSNRVIEMFPENRFFESENEKQKSPETEHLLRFLQVSVLCNEASFDTKNRHSENHAIGDPTETALLIAFEKFGFDVHQKRANYIKIKEYPFDSLTKRMITVVQGKDGKLFAAMKGAPGVVLDICDKYISSDGNEVILDELTREGFLSVNREMAERALRVLAFADKNFENQTDLQIDSNIKNGYTFLGFVGIVDPLRSGAAEAVKKARDAGIRVVMLTGDQINTARAIARELQIDKTTPIIALHSNELAEADSEKFIQMARQADVFARVSPEDKLRIVNVLQKAGEIVAVTGDGVNDAPALKHADIGIAMGMRGTEVAKEASDIVLMDDNFKTIVKAIEGGRTIYANILKFVHLMFSHNLGEVLMIFAAIMSGLPLPLLPLQILWINLVTDVFPALALAVEPPSPETMKRKPHSPTEVMLSSRFLFLIFWQGVMLATIALLAYLWALNEYGEGTHARSVALFTLIGVQLGHLYNCRSKTRSAFRNFFSNPYIFVATAIVLGLQLMAIYFSPLAEILDIVPPNNVDFVVIIISIIIPIIVVEITKLIFRNIKYS
jgi:Ca2+-transporting ATPase